MVLKNKKAIAIHVTGLKDKFESEYGPESLTDDDMPQAVNRVLQFAARFCKTIEDNNIYFYFRAENGIEIEEFSFAAALESMLLGMDPEIVCSGDSCPNIDYEVQANMAPDTIALKLGAFPDNMYYIKADTSTKAGIDPPENVVNLSMDFVDLDEHMPEYVVCENPLPFMI